MATSIVDAQSILAIDLGSVHTRALLFDVVEGQYRFIGSGIAASTANAPFRDIGEGFFRAVLNLQEKLGRTLIKDDRLILPSREDNAGVDRLVAAYTAGPELRIVTAGLLTDVSLQSIQRLAGTVSGQVAESLSLGDRRRPEARIDAVLQAKPDLIIFGGGTEGGAGRSVFKLAELLILVCRILPQEQRPHILYTGNQALARKIQEALSKWTTVHIAPNVRPGIDQEDISPAQEVLAELVTDFRKKQLGGMQTLADQCSAVPLPVSHAMGRMVRFLSRAYDPQKSVLGIDIGSQGVILAAAQDGRLNLAVAPYGLGSSARRLTEPALIEEINRWLTIYTPPELLRDYLWQKSLYPASIPGSAETLAIEQAMAKVILRRSFLQAKAENPDLGEVFEPILAGGSIFNQAPTAGEALMMLLDGLQPVGVSTVILDKHSLLAALGAAAEVNPLLPVQALESSAFLNLGTVICPYSPARYGAPILNVRVEYEKGNESRMEIRQGTFTVLPLKNGQTVRLHLEPLRKTVVDPTGQRSANSFKITGGLCGAVIDARGRPVPLPKDAARRRDVLKKWKQVLSG
ncbi:MAG: glutamate mutase L [Anaerolineaceae bacterium]|nr:glutamate mutase L [Anaerolineaceae bacterium]